MRKKILIMMILINLNACGSGGGGSNGGGQNNNSVINNMLPLQVSMHDLNDNFINYINVYKVGSVDKYKLTFTNPNPFAVSPPQSTYIGADSGWLTVNNKVDMPGSNGAITSIYEKTQNLDDCLNIQKNQLPYHNSCNMLS